MEFELMLTFLGLLFHIISIVVGQSRVNSSEQCRSAGSKNIHPICIIQSNTFTSAGCISQGVIYLWMTRQEPNPKRTIFCSAHYPIEIVLNFREKYLRDVTLDFPEFERTVEDISKPGTYIYYIRVPYGFMTRPNSDVKSFTIRSINEISISTSFVNQHHNYGNRRDKELERAQGLKSVIPVTQELINLPCPIYESGRSPEGVYRILPDSNSTEATAKMNLVKSALDFVESRSNDSADLEIRDLWHINIPVDNKRLLWDPINGFRFNISNWPSKEYLGSYFCTTAEHYWATSFKNAKNFTLVDLKEAPFGIPDSEDIYITTVARTIDISFECLSAKNITFESVLNHSLVNSATITREKSPECIQNTIFHLVYHLNITTYGSENEKPYDGYVQCIDIEAQRLVRTWRLTVMDIRLRNGSWMDKMEAKYLIPLELGQHAAVARCNGWLIVDASIKYLTCRNMMECDMFKFCLQDNASCQNIATTKHGRCETVEDCEEFKPPDNGILSCPGVIDDVFTELSVTYFKGFDGRIYADWMDAPIPALIQFEESILGKITLYSKDWLEVSCKGHRMLTGGLIQWILHFNNNSWTHITVSNNSDVIIELEKLLDGIKSTLHIYLASSDIVGITCMVPVWNSDKWANRSRVLHVVEPSKPKIKSGGSVKSFKIGSKYQSISCEVLSDPASELTWTKLGTNATHNLTISYQVNFASLQFPEFSSNDVGDYVCEASNSVGTDSKTFHVSIDEGTNSSLLYTALAVLLILLSISVSLILWIRRKLQKAKRADAETQIKESIDKFLNGYEDEDSNADKYPYNNEYEIPMENLTIDRIQVLGSGAFGVVYRGRIEGHSGTVAIKTLHQMPRYNVEYFQSLLSELKLLIFIGKHPNIVELVGAVTVKIHSGEFYIVSEECVLGSLQNFLRSKRRNMGLTCETSVQYTDLTNDEWKVEQEKELLEYLMKWSNQIADAMEFLSAKNVIHADLATRNILLTADHDAKITDFGLSRKLYNYVQYVKKKKEPLPWAWMSIEALRELAFSSKSDVWSYGVVLWEMYSFAAVPYGGMNWDPEFVHKLKDGLRLPKPELATDSIYDTMYSCWSIEPGDRPDFSDLKSCLGSNKECLECSASQEINCDSVEASYHNFVMAV